MLHAQQSPQEMLPPEPSREILRQYVVDFAERFCDSARGTEERTRNRRNYVIGVYLLEMYDVETGELFKPTVAESAIELNNTYYEHLRAAADSTERPYTPPRRILTANDWYRHFLIVYTRCPHRLQDNPWAVVTGLHEGTIDYEDLPSGDLP